MNSTIDYQLTTTNYIEILTTIESTAESTADYADVGDCSSVVKRMQAVFNIVFAVGYPSFFIIGLLTNILTIIVLRSWQKKLTTWILLLVSIAVSDLLVVTFSFIYSSWLVQYVDARLNIKYTSDIYCKVIIFLQQTSRCVSAWLVMVATLERVLCITTSVKRTMCTRKVTAVTICVLVLIGMCINAPQFLQMHGAPPLSNLLMCVAKPFPLHDLATWINITFSQIVPLTFMTIFNLFLLHFLIRYHADRSKKFTTDVTRCSANIKGQVDPKTVLQLTLVSIFYVIFETPYTISALFLKSAFESQVPLCDVKFYKALYDIIHAVSWLNHCNNFFLYILCNKKFRDLFVAKLSNPFKTIHINSPPNSV